MTALMEVTNEVVLKDATLRNHLAPGKKFITTDSTGTGPAQKLRPL